MVTTTGRGDPWRPDRPQPPGRRRKDGIRWIGASLLMHQVMLGDVSRLRAYDAAIARAVRPGDVVVNVGAGTLILSLMALRHGARHVYALEADPEMAAVARKVAGRNRLGGRLTLVQGDARAVRLPEKADVLVAEMMGNLGPEEEMAEILRDVARANLRPGGQVIPRRLVTHSRRSSSTTRAGASGGTTSGAARSARSRSSPRRRPSSTSSAASRSGSATPSSSRTAASASPRRTRRAARHWRSPDTAGSRPSSAISRPRWHRGCRCRTSRAIRAATGRSGSGRCSTPTWPPATGSSSKSGCPRDVRLATEWRLDCRIAGEREGVMAKIVESLRDLPVCRIPARPPRRRRAPLRIDLVGRPALVLGRGPRPDHRRPPRKRRRRAPAGLPGRPHRLDGGRGPALAGRRGRSPPALIDPDTGRVIEERDNPRPAGVLCGLEAAGDAIWMGYKNPAVLDLRRRSDLALIESIPVDAEVAGVTAVGPFVAFADFSRAIVTLIDPATKGVARRVGVPGHPTGLSWDGRRAWYCDYTGVQLRAVDLPGELRVGGAMTVARWGSRVSWEAASMVRPEATLA